MKKIIKFLLFAIFIILIILPMIYTLNYETIFVVKEFDYPLEWKQGEVKVAEISPEELNQYPILKNLTNGDCSRFDKNWWCKVNSEEWIRTKNFIDKKENADTCIKIGEKCYIIDFTTCCNKKIEITNIVLSIPNDTEINKQKDKNSEISLILEMNIQNDQNIGTGLLSGKINIKNSSNVVVVNYTTDEPFYIKNNTEMSTMMTASFPGPGKYDVEVQVIEKGKIITQRSTNVTIEPSRG